MGVPVESTWGELQAPPTARAVLDPLSPWGTLSGNRAQPELEALSGGRAQPELGTHQEMGHNQSWGPVREQGTAETGTPLGGRAQQS